MNDEGKSELSVVGGGGRNRETRDGRRLEIREALGREVELIYPFLDVIALESDFLSYGPGELGRTLDEERKMIDTLAAADNGLYIVAWVEERIAGILFFIGGTRPRLRHVGEFGVAVGADFWGQGVGTVLMEYFLDWARHNPVVRKINLTARGDNHRAIKMYEGLGFRIEGRQSRDIFLDGVFYDGVLMGLEI